MPRTSPTLSQLMTQIDQQFTSEICVMAEDLSVDGDVLWQKLDGFRGLRRISRQAAVWRRILDQIRAQTGPRFEAESNRLLSIAKALPIVGLQTRIEALHLAVRPNFPRVNARLLIELFAEIAQIGESIVFQFDTEHTNDVL